MATWNVGLSGHGAKLRELRVKRGLSLRTLAARTGFSPTYISEVEADVVSPWLASVERIADELGARWASSSRLLTSAPRTIMHRAERPGYESARPRSTVGVKRAKREARAC